MPNGNHKDTFHISPLLFGFEPSKLKLTGPIIFYTLKKFKSPTQNANHLKDFKNLVIFYNKDTRKSNTYGKKRKNIRRLGRREGTYESES